MNAKWLAVMFALATVQAPLERRLPQINAIASGLEATFDLEPLITAVTIGFVGICHYWGYYKITGGCSCRYYGARFI